MVEMCLQAPFFLCYLLWFKDAHREQRQVFFCALEIDHFPSDHQHARGKERTLQGKMFKPGKMIVIYLHSQL